MFIFYIKQKKTNKIICHQLSELEAQRKRIYFANAFLEVLI